MRAMWRDLRHASHFATQRATAGNGPARSNPGGEGPHPQPADSQKNPRGTAAATRARGPVSHPAGRRYADPRTGRKGQDDGHEWAEDRAAHSLSVVLFTSRTTVAGLSGMASGCAMVRQPHREGRGIYRGGGQRERVGSVDDTVRALLLPAPARRALRAGVAGRRFQPFSVTSYRHRHRAPHRHRSGDGHDPAGPGEPAVDRRGLHLGRRPVPDRPCRRQPFAVDLVAGGRPFGQVAEALMTVGGQEF